MASEWARKKAEEIIGHCDIFMLTSHVAARAVAADMVAAALDEARAEGEKEASAAYKKGYIRGLTEGAERERWECHRIADSWAARFEARGQDEGDVAAGKVAVSIAARGPMRGPEAEALNGVQPEPSFRSITATRCLRHATVPPTILPPAEQECGVCMREEGILVGKAAK